MKSPSVAICVINYTSKKHTIELLESLNSLKGDFEVFILENNSPENVFEKSDIPKKIKYKVNYFKSDENLGFAGGNNYLLKKASGKFDYYWLLNNDTLVEKDSLEQLLKVFENYENVGLVGSLLVHSDGSTVWWAGSKMDLDRGAITKLYFGQDKSVVPTSVFETDEVTGASTLLSTKYLEEVGYMDESFFHTWEDSDYSYRGSIKGFKHYVSPSSFVIHKVGKSSGTEYSAVHMYYIERGRLLLMKKHGFFSMRSIPFLIPLWIKRTLAPAIKKGNIRSFLYTIAGIIDGINGKTGKKDF